MKVLNTTLVTLLIGFIVCMIATLVNNATLPQVVSMWDVSNFVGAAGNKYQVVSFGEHFITSFVSDREVIASAGEMLRQNMGCDLVSIQFGVVECVK